MGEKVVGFKASEGEFDQAQFSDTLIRCHLSFFIVAYTMDYYPCLYERFSRI